MPHATSSQGILDKIHADNTVSYWRNHDFKHSYNSADIPTSQQHASTQAHQAPSNPSNSVRKFLCDQMFTTALPSGGGELQGVTAGTAIMREASRPLQSALNPSRRTIF